MHRVLSRRTPSAFHTLTADSSVASTAPWAGWQRMHFTIGPAEVAAGIAGANAAFNLSLGADPADWLLVHTNVELEGTSAVTAGHSLRGLTIAWTRPAAAPPARPRQGVARTDGAAM